MSGLGRRERGGEAKAESVRVMLACMPLARPAIGEINQNTQLQHDPSLAWLGMGTGRGLCSLSCFQRLLVGQSELKMSGRA